MNRLLILALTLLTACSSIDLDPRWQPLTTLKERPDLPGEGLVITTTGETAWVSDFDRFEEVYSDPVRLEGLLLHEREHALSQFDYGLWKWLWRYAHDVEFAWAEEQRGWEVEIRHLVRAGYWTTGSAESVAKILSSYKTLTLEPLVSYEEALIWVREVAR